MTQPTPSATSRASRSTSAASTARRSGSATGAQSATPCNRTGKRTPRYAGTYEYRCDCGTIFSLSVLIALHHSSGGAASSLTAPSATRSPMRTPTRALRRRRRRRTRAPRLCGPAPAPPPPQAPVAAAPAPLLQQRPQRNVCSLFNLQTLELQNSAFLVELPNDIKNLNRLYHLDAFKEHGLIYVPPGTGQLTNLRTLTTFTVGGVSWNCNVSELAHLNSLRRSLDIRNLNNVENEEDAMRACLATKKLKKVSLEWCNSGEDNESDDRISVAGHVVDALKPHSLLEELNIKGYYGLELPSSVADHSLPDLVSITLDDCYNCEKLPPLGVLPVLRCLFTQNLRRVQIISSEFCTTGTINHELSEVRNTKAA